MKRTSFKWCKQRAFITRLKQPLATSKQAAAACVLQFQLWTRFPALKYCLCDIPPLNFIRFPTRLSARSCWSIPMTFVWGFQLCFSTFQAEMNRFLQFCCCEKRYPKTRFLLLANASTLLLLKCFDPFKAAGNCARFQWIVASNFNTLRDKTLRSSVNPMPIAAIAPSFLCTSLIAMPFEWAEKLMAWFSKHSEAAMPMEIFNSIGNYRSPHQIFSHSSLFQWKHLSLCRFKLPKRRLNI